MRVRLLLSLVAIFSAFAVSAEVSIASITPASSPESGGTEVLIAVQAAIEGAGGCLISPTPPPQVMFGDVVVNGTFVGEWPANRGTVKVTAPAHAPGIVDVQLLICGNPPALAQHSFTYFDPATAPNPDNYERVLLPVFYFGPGARGSEWVTSAGVFNGGPTNAEFARPIFEGPGLCPALCGCSLGLQLVPLQTALVCPTLGAPWGLLIYPSKETSGNLFYSLNVRDTSRRADSAGTEIPLVREEDLRSRIALPHVPSEPEFRIAIRIYDPNGRDGGQVQLRIFSENGGPDPILDQVVTLVQPIRNIVFDPFPSSPAFAYVADPLPAFQPSLGRLLVEITSIAPLERIWAFVSITNNTTQEVTTITPQ